MTFLTNLKFEPKGKHDAAQAYNVTDVVTSADGSTAYAAVKDVPAGTAITNTSYWVKLLDIADARIAALDAADSANTAANSGIRTDAAQNLNTAQKDTAQENIGLKEIIYGLTDGFEVSGNPVQCNPVGGLVFDGVETQFPPKQAGSGDPYPAGGGKNLINPGFYVSSKTENGVTFTVNADGTILMNGTATDTTMFDLFVGADNNGMSYLTSNQAYTISFGSAFAAISGTARMAVGYRELTTDSWNYSVYAYGSESKTFTLPDGAIYTLIRIRLSAGDVCNNVLVQPQIELGSAATDFKPYSNIRPISGWESLNLTRSGKNLASPPKSNLTTSATFEYDEATSTLKVTKAIAAGGWGQMYYELSGDVSHLVGQSVTLSIQNFSTTDTSDNPRIFLTTQAGKTITSLYPKVNYDSTSSYSRSNAGVVPEGTTKFMIIARVDQNSTLPAGAMITIKGLQVEIGNTVKDNGASAPEFTPYAGNNLFTVQIGQTVYGGRMNWLTGELTAEWEVLTSDGTEAWKVISTGSYPYFYFNIGASGYVIDNESQCSHYIRENISNSVNGPYNRFNAANSTTGYARLIVRPDMTAYPDVDTWKTYLAAQYAAGTPVQIAYKLATPTTIQLTPHQITALQGVNTLYGDGDAIGVAGRQSQNIALESRIEALEAAILNA